MTTDSSTRLTFDLKHWCFGVNWCNEKSWAVVYPGEKLFIMCIRLGPWCILRSVKTSNTPQTDD